MGWVPCWYVFFFMLDLCCGQEMNITIRSSIIIICYRKKINTFFTFLRHFSSRHFSLFSLFISFFFVLIAIFSIVSFKFYGNYVFFFSFTFLEGNSFFFFLIFFLVRHFGTPFLVILCED